MYNPFSLADKTILITGASSGIGKATAIECSKMGATLIITGRNSERLQQTYDFLDQSNGQQHKQIVADLSTDDGIDYLMSHIVNLDGVALCAGIVDSVPFKFCTRDKFDKIFNTNFFSPIELIRVLFKKKMLNKSASVCVISSIGGLYKHAPGNAMYGASKAALSSIVKYCAKEFVSRKIRLNAICPGMVHTPMTQKIGPISKEQLEEDEKKYPLGRYGVPEDIAYATVYLLSDASAWLTGQNIIIDGGLTI